MLNAAVLTMFPVLYFFSWLYYTDPGSTCFTLLMFSFCLSRQHLPAALMGCVAIMFRQTNIVWVLFCTGMVKDDVLEEYVRSKKRGRVNLKSLPDLEQFKVIMKYVFESQLSVFMVGKRIFLNSYWYGCVILCFAIFVFVNKGIVVGDRSNHQAVLNCPQVFYFLAISGAFSIVHLISTCKIKRFMLAIRANPIKLAVLVSLMVVLVRLFTYEHKYTLSDNRHYTFYVWSKIYRRNEFIRYALIPGYIYCLYQFYCLTLHKGLVWRLTMLVCTVAVLVPQALFEFRYYIIPFYLIRLNMPLPCSKLLFVELILYSIINAFTVYMFVQKTFSWPDELSPQRFMW